MEDDALYKYIEESLANGVSKEEIFKTLLAEGWEVDVIQKSLSDATAESKKEDTQKRTTKIIIGIGITLIAAGIFSFIASNWDGIPDFLKVVLLLIIMISAYSAGGYFQNTKKMERMGQGLYILGALSFGGTIFLLGQIFNIRVNWPDGFIIWMMGTIIMAQILNSYPLFGLGIPIGIVAIIGHPLTIVFDSSSNSYLLTSTLLLLIATGITYYVGASLRKKIPPNLKNYY